MLLTILKMSYLRKNMSHQFEKKVLVLCCDQCGIFYTNRYMSSVIDRVNHFCSCLCKNEATKLGGVVQEKMQKTSMKRYGTKHPQQSESIRVKTKQTCLQKYGFECSLQSSVVRLKCEDACIKKYGCKSYAASGEFRQVLKKANQERFGVDYASQSPIVRDKTRNTVKQRYGVENVSQSSVVKSKKIETFRRKYGVDNPFQSSEIMSCVDVDAARKKRHETMKLNGSFRKSKPEDIMYVLLQEIYGYEDIERQVNVHKWPIDFYVKSLDMYIQCDGVYWHGLDRPIEEIVKHKTKRDTQIHKKWLTDREQNEWFSKHGLCLVRITEKELNQCLTRTSL